MKKNHHIFKQGEAFDIPLLRRVYAFTNPYKKQFYLTIFLTLLLAILAPVRPWLIQYTIDNFIFTFDENGLLFMTLLMIVIILVNAIIQYYHTYISNWVGQSVIKDLRVMVFSHILKLRLKFFDKTAIGTLITRTISDIETIADVFSEGLVVIIADLLQIVTIVTVMFYTDWQLTLVSISVFPFLIFATYLFKVNIKRAFQDVRNQVARLNAFTNEHITGMSTIQIFNREEIEMQKFKKINSEHKNAHIQTIWYYSLFFPVVEILSAISIGLMIWWGTKNIIDAHISLGVLIAFLLYISMLFRPIRELADKFNTLQMGMVSSDRVFKILDTQEFISNNGKHHVSKIDGKVHFENVWFAYNKDQHVLKNISFEVEAGKTLAIVGTTGSGKSTIINALYRFYDIEKGTIKIDDVDIREYELNMLRSNMALVLQDVFLFSDSIENNITLKDKRITKEQIYQAAKIIGIDEFINKLPGNYNFNVHERGIMLSVGQRQLISFIRALVANPKILILDEATSSIDTETEHLIQEAILKLVKNRTSIVIAHRLSTIQNADKIIVLDHGEIKETGNHKELLNYNGHYKKLYEIQFQNTV